MKRASLAVATVALVAVLVIGGWAVSEYRFDTCADRAVAQYPLGSASEDPTPGIWGPGSDPRADRLAARRKAMNACSRWPI